MKKKKQEADEVYVQVNPVLASIIESTLAERAKANSPIEINEDIYSDRNTKKRKPKSQNKKKAQKMSRKKQRKTKC